MYPTSLIKNIKRTIKLFCKTKKVEKKKKNRKVMNCYSQWCYAKAKRMLKSIVNSDQMPDSAFNAKQSLNKLKQNCIEAAGFNLAEKFWLLRNQNIVCRFSLNEKKIHNLTNDLLWFDEYHSYSVIQIFVVWKGKKFSDQSKR